MPGKSTHGWMGVAVGAILGALAAAILGSGGVWLAIGIAVGIAMGAAIFRETSQGKTSNDQHITTEGRRPTTEKGASPWHY